MTMDQFPEPHLKWLNSSSVVIRGGKNSAPSLNCLNLSPTSTSTDKEQQSTPTDLRSRWIELFFQSHSFAAKTETNYRRELLRFLSWTDKPWNEVSHRDIANYKAYLEKLTKADGQSPLSKDAIALALSALKSFFKWMATAGTLESNPTVGISAPTPVHVEPQHLEPEEMEIVYAAIGLRGATAVRDRALVAVLEHGLRANEAAALKIGDYNGEEVVVRQAKHDSVGAVPLSPEAIAAIDDYLDERQQQGDELALDSPLFLSNSPKASQRGKGLGYYGIYWMVKDLGILAESILISRWFPDLPLFNKSEVEQLNLLLSPKSPQGITPVEPDSDSIKGKKRSAPQESSFIVAWASQLTPAQKQSLLVFAQLHPHQFRHTFATKLVVLGIDSYLARKLTRHESEKSFRRYSEHGRAIAAKQAYLEAIQRQSSQGE